MTEVMEEIQGLGMFNGPEHAPIHLERGEPGALLIHGFPGTPAEVRPLARLLFDAGWSVRAPLLPGFGADIETLFERDHEAWMEAVDEALQDLAQDHHPVLLIGHSMGGALALHAAARRPVSGLVVLAPFWKLPLDNFWFRLLSPILHLVIPKARPFQRLDFDRPEIREGIHEFMPDVDLDDPQVREKIRETAVPTRIFTELRRLGRRARRAAADVTTPTLVVQGTADDLVPPARTRELLVDLGGAVTYHELPAEHNLVREETPAWPQVKQVILSFAEKRREEAHEASRIARPEVRTSSPSTHPIQHPIQKE
jgi:carboxylesterase